MATDSSLRSTLILSRETATWLALVLLTAASWLLAEEYTAPHLQNVSVQTISSGLIILAFIKIRMVILSFMEIKHAPLSLRILFELWVVGICATLLVMYYH